MILLALFAVFTLSEGASLSSSVCSDTLNGYTALKPYPDDCRMYIKCFGLTMSTGYCPVGLYFDPWRQMCDTPDMADCNPTDDVLVPTSSPITASEKPITDIRCQSGGESDYWAAESCTQYVVCRGGYAYLEDCPGGLRYDPAGEMCVDEHYYFCAHTVTPPSVRH